MTTPVILLLVLGAWAGALLIWMGWKDRRDPNKPPKRPRRPLKISRQQRVVLLIGAVLGVAVWLMSGWFIAVPAGPAVAWILPVLFGPNGAKERIERLDALSEWTRLLSSSVSVTGLEQAIVATQGSIPGAISDEVTALIARIRTNTISTKAAIKAFAEDLDDGETGDLIAATLLVAADKRSSGLRRVLEALAESVDEDVRNRRAVEAERQGIRTQTRSISIFICLILGWLFLGTGYMDPYKQGAMQIVLAALLSAFVAILYWMHRMTLEKRAPRFMGPLANPAVPKEKEVSLT